MEEAGEGGTPRVGFTPPGEDECLRSGRVIGSAMRVVGTTLLDVLIAISVVNQREMPERPTELEIGHAPGLAADVPAPALTLDPAPDPVPGPALAPLAATEDGLPLNLRPGLVTGPADTVRS